MPILANLLGASTIGWSDSPRAEESSAWAAALNEVDETYYKGRAKSAIKLADEAIRLAHETGAQQELFALRRVQDICFRISDFQCAGAYGLQIGKLIRQMSDASGISPEELRWLTVESLERLTRLLLMFGQGEKAKEIAEKLEAALGAPNTSTDFVQANFTLARVALLRDDQAKAARFIRTAWLFFLSNKSIPERHFMRYMAEFIDLFRATGQTQRAFAAKAIASRTLVALTSFYKYDAVAMLFAAQGVSIDSNLGAPVVTAMTQGLGMLDSLELDDSIRTFYRIQALISLVVNCAITKYPDCPNNDVVNELVAGLEKIQKEPPQRGIGTAAREIATATAMWAAVNHREVPKVAETILRLPPPDASTREGAYEQFIYFAGRYFLATVTDDPERVAFAVKAANSELIRLRRAQASQPFNVAPLGLYTRVMFFITAWHLATKPQRSLEEDGQLLELVTYLNRTTRNLESDYLYLLSETAGTISMASLQALHRAEQNLARLEKKALTGLTDELWQRKPGRPASQLSGEIWSEFGQLAVLIDGHGDAHQKASELVARQRNLLSDVREALRANERFVTHVSDGTNIIRLCVGRNDIAVGLDTLDGHGEIAQIKLLQAALTNPSPPSVEIDSQFPLAASRRLSRLILGSDPSCVGNAEHLVIAPDPALLSLPFHVLTDPTDDSDREDIAGHWFQGVKWLGTTRALSIVVDAKQFVASRKLRFEQGYSHAFLGVGDPRLTGDTANGANRLEAALRGVKRGGAALTQIDELPDTAKELEQLSRIFGASSELLLGDHADELALRRKLLINYRVISFATHGLIREEIQGLNEAALLLTPRDSDAEVDDGLLTATEISQLDVNADLVILSACNSARFDVDLFGPEAASLSSAFFLAGARSTLASLWSVDSEATARLMSLFAEEYTQKQQPGASMALRNAISKFIDTAPSNEFRNPRFWAPFTVFGDGGSPNIGLGKASREFSLDANLPHEMEVRGEISSATRIGGGVLLSGTVDEGKSRLVGYLRFLDDDGKQRWQVRDETRSFIAASSPTASSLTILAWNYAIGESSIFEVLTYGIDGKLRSRGRIDNVDSELIDGFLRIDDDRFVLVTHGDSPEKSAYVQLRLVNSTGQLLQERRISGEGTVAAKVFLTAGGFWLALTGEDATKPPPQRLSPIGSPVLCLKPTGTDLWRFSALLEPVSGPTKFNDMEIEDILEIRPGVQIIASSLVYPCVGYNRRSILAVLDPKTGPQLHDLPITDFSNRPKRLFKNEDGSIFVIGSAEREVDFFHPAMWTQQPRLDRAGRIRRMSSYNHSGGYIARFDRSMQKVEVSLYFNGTDLFFDDVTTFGTGWLLVGANGDSQFLGRLTAPATLH